MRKSRSPVLIMAVAVALGAFVALNVAAKRFQGGGHEEEAAQQQQEQQQQQAQAAQQTDAQGQKLIELPAEVTSGPKGATKTVVLGWSWTPEVQANPGALYQKIEAIRSAAPPDTRVRIVNRDVVPDAPAGLQVNGQVVVRPEQLEEMPAQMIGQAIGANVNRPRSFMPEPPAPPAPAPR